MYRVTRSSPSSFIKEGEYIDLADAKSFAKAVSLEHQDELVFVFRTVGEDIETPAEARFWNGREWVPGRGFKDNG